MATESEIIKLIKKKVLTSEIIYYSIWTIGMTADPEKRREDHGNPHYWLQWQADSETAARNVVKYFLDLGMKDTMFKPQQGTTIYIF